jgi:2-amino-4-hydroxy-6-hydroxymethyldihydropteridine diphosphokinase
MKSHPSSASPDPPSAIAYVALGSNLGESRRILESAMERLQTLSVRPLLKSSIYMTTPVECPPGSPDFLNAVAGLFPLPGETPESLLEKLHGLEREFGRRAKVMLNEPRTLDLDLIAFGRETRGTLEIILPHPRAHLRRFVLEPLSEIAPQLILPGQSLPVSELVKTLCPDGCHRAGSFC